MDEIFGNIEPLSSEPELLNIGSMKISNRLFNTAHTHNFCEISYVSKGNARFIIENKEYNIKSGNIVVINPNVLHEEYLVTSDESLHSCFFTIAGLDIENIGKGNLLAIDANPVLCVGNFQNIFESYLFDLLKESYSQETDKSRKCQDVISKLLKLIIYISKLDNDRFMDDSIILNICQKIKDYIDLHYCESIDLDMLASIAFISKDYLSHIFKLYVGVSPIRYLINCRINAARSLVDQTNLNISQISKKVGYEDPLYFSQIFKKVVGVSPQKYKRLSQ